MNNAYTVVCLGFFDGVHRGHQALLKTAREIADRQGGRVIAHTFDRVPGAKGPELTPLSARRAWLLRFGADEVAVSAFSDEMRQMSGEDFVRHVLISHLRADHLVCGCDHRFGHKGQCGTEELSAFCHSFGLSLTVVPPVLLPDGQKISSSLIRSLLSEGKTAQAEAMLGHPLILD